MDQQPFCIHDNFKACTTKTSLFPSYEKKVNKHLYKRTHDSKPSKINFQELELWPFITSLTTHKSICVNSSHWILILGILGAMRLSESTPKWKINCQCKIPKNKSQDDPRLCVLTMGADIGAGIHRRFPEMIVNMILDQWIYHKVVSFCNSFLSAVRLRDLSMCVHKTIWRGMVLSGM